MTDAELSGYFDHIFLLNLDSRPDRLAEFQTELNAFSPAWPFIQPERFPAISKEIAGNGTAGCRQSYIKMWQECLNKNHKQVLFIEDDFGGPPDFTIRVRKFLEDVPNDWDALFIGNAEQCEYKDVKPGIKKSTCPNRLHCFALRPNAILTCLKWAKYGPTEHGPQTDWISRHKRHDAHVDHVISKALGKMNVYSPDPILACQRPSKSDIGNNITKLGWWGNAPADRTASYIPPPPEENPPSPQEIQGRYLWYELHVRTLAIHDEEEDRRWLEGFTNRVPAGGQCRCKENWRKELIENPPPLGKDMFDWGMDQHDKVNVRKGKKRFFINGDGTLDYASGREFWQKAAPIPDGFSIAKATNKITTDPRTEIALKSSKESFPPQKSDFQPINGILTDDQFASLFEAVYVINLKRRPERLDAFYKHLEPPFVWPFKRPERLEAIDGDALGKNSTWGCRESHAAALRDALTKGLSRILILEDDAVFADNFAIEARNFIKDVPEWDGIWFGNEHRGNFQVISPGVLRATNPHRLHAYALRGKAIRAMYDWLVYGPRATNSKEWWLDHADHVTGEMLGNDFKVYFPDPLLAFQGGGYSDIKGQVKPFETFGHAARTLPYIGDKLVLLKCEREVREQLRGMGMHGGYSIATNGSDNWLNKQLVDGLDKDRLMPLFTPWLEIIQNEAAMAGKIPTVWMPAVPEMFTNIIKNCLGNKAIDLTCKDAQEAKNLLANHSHKEPDHKNKFWAYVVIRNGDVELFPHWLKHYKALNVDKFIVHIRTPVDEDVEKRIQALSNQFDFTRIDTPLNIATIEDHELDKRKVLRHLKALPETWIMASDLDEFQQYPDSLQAIGEAAYRNGIVCVHGQMIDRVAEDGALNPVLAEPSIFDQFPMRCNLTGTIVNGSISKIPLARYSVPLGIGHHWVTQSVKMQPPLGTREDYIIWHFKWKAGLVERLKWGIAANSIGTWKTEAETFLTWIDKNNGKIDLKDKRLIVKRA